MPKKGVRRGRIASRKKATKKAKKGKSKRRRDKDPLQDEPYVYQKTFRGSSEKK